MRIKPWLEMLAPKAFGFSKKFFESRLSSQKSRGERYGYPPELKNAKVGVLDAVLRKLACRQFKDNAARLHLFTLADNLVNSLRQLALPRSIHSWNLTTLREKLVKIGAKVVSHAKYVVFQLAEVAVPRQLSAAILGRIGRLRLAEAAG